MKDLVPKGTGNSRLLRSSIPANITHEELVALLRAGTFPVDFAGLNADGVAVVGSAYNKANVLPDDLCSKLGIPTTTAEPKDAFSILNNAGWKEYQRITSSGNFIVPDDVYRIAAIIISGGGSGGSRIERLESDESVTVNGGVPGGVAFAVMDVMPGQSIKCVIGAGGGSETGSNSGGNDDLPGKPGGASSFGGITPTTEQCTPGASGYIVYPGERDCVFAPQKKFSAASDTLTWKGSQSTPPSGSVHETDFGHSGATMIKKVTQTQVIKIQGDPGTGYGNAGGGVAAVNYGTKVPQNATTVSGAGAPGAIIVYV